VFEPRSAPSRPSLIPPPLSLLPASTPPCPLTPRNSLYLSRSARNTAQYDPTIPDLPRTSRYDVPDVRNSFHGAILVSRSARALHVKRVSLENEKSNYYWWTTMWFAKNIDRDFITIQSCNNGERVEINSDLNIEYYRVILLHWYMNFTRK